MNAPVSRRVYPAAHILFVLLVLSTLLPGRAGAKADPVCMLAACALAEAVILWRQLRGKGARAAGDIGAVLFLALLAWQVCTTRLGLGHVILAPTPEAVFSVFYTQRRRMAEGKCFLQPSLGLRQFVCYFELYDPARHTDQPIPEDLDAGLMVYDLFDPYDGSVQKKTQTQLALFHAVMRQGVVQVPPYESPEVFKGGSGAC